MSFTILPKSSDNKPININFANQIPNYTPIESKVKPSDITNTLGKTSANFGKISVPIGISGDNLNSLETYLKNVKVKDTGAPTDVFDKLNSLASGSHFLLKKESVGSPVYKQIKDFPNKRFFNLSLKEIIDKTILTIVAIFIDLTNQKYVNMNLDNVMIYLNIFYKDDRMIYFGIFLIFLSLLFMFF